MSPQRRQATGGRIDALLRPNLGPEQRLAVLASEWFGLDLPDAPLAIDGVPPLLRRLWDAGAERSMLCFQDWLLAEDAVEVAQDGSLVFYGENEWCWAASYRPDDGPNPLVYFDEDYGPSPSSITPSGMMLDEFLLREALLAAEVAAPVFGFVAVDRVDHMLDDLLEGLSPIVDGVLIGQFSGDPFWTDGLLLASLRRNVSLMVGACRREHLAASSLGRLPMEAWHFFHG